MPSRGSRGGCLFILFPLSVESKPEGGQILQRPDRQGTQGGGPTSAGLRTPPHRTPQRAGSGPKSKHFNGGCSDPPHSTHGGQGSSPSQRKTKAHPRPGLLPPATELQAGGLGGLLLVLLPAGSMGDRDRGPQLGSQAPGPGRVPCGPTPSQENPTTGGGETRCGLHGGGWEGLRAPEAAPWRSGQTGTEGHQGGRGEAGAGAQQARYSQCLVGALLGFEEAQDKEGHCLQTQHHHHATDEAGPVKAGAVGLRDRGALCRVEATAGHCRPGARPHPKTRPRSSGGPQSSLGEPWAAGSDIPPRFYRWLESAWKHLALAPLPSCAVA